MAHLTGCSIIDFNPGVGLWSSKLHDALKPRSHVLVEQDSDFYLPFLTPLLDSPGSRYHLRRWHDRQPWTPNSYVSEGLIPELEKTPTTDGRNDTLLIIANLAYGSKREVRGLIPSHLNIHTYVNHLRSQRGFHAHGSVRLLLWMPNTDKNMILPRTVLYRKKLSVEVEMVCNVEEIAGGGIDTQISSVREPFLDFRSSKRVAERMKTQNIQIPFSRQDVAQKAVYEALLNPAEDSTKGLEDSHVLPTGFIRDWHSELKQLERDFRDAKFPQTNPSPSASTDQRKPPQRMGRPRKEPREKTPEFVRLSNLKNHLALDNRVRVKVDELIQEQEAIDRLHSGILNKAFNEPERQGKLAELQQRAEGFKVQRENLTRKANTHFNINSDNRRAFMMDSPLLMWDHRTAEPLIVRKNEFCDPTQLALLDFQPLSPSPYPITSAQSVMFALIMGGLLNHPTDTIYHLNNLAPGAADAIIPHVSALHDPQRGGRYDLSEFRIRCLTPEMFYGIVQAWDNWPFKPLISEMAAGYEELQESK